MTLYFDERPVKTGRQIVFGETVQLGRKETRRNLGVCFDRGKGAQVLTSGPIPLEQLAQIADALGELLSDPPPESPEEIESV